MYVAHSTDTFGVLLLSSKPEPRAPGLLGRLRDPLARAPASAPPRVDVGNVYGGLVIASADAADTAAAREPHANAAACAAGDRHRLSFA